MPSVRARAEAAEAKLAQAIRRMQCTPPWPTNDPLTAEQMQALRLRWAFGPDLYQADADALISTVLHLWAEVERLTRDFAAFRETARELETALRHQRVEAQEKVERLKAENAAGEIIKWRGVTVRDIEVQRLTRERLTRELAEERARVAMVATGVEHYSGCGTLSFGSPVCARCERDEANRLLERALSGKHDDSCAGHTGRDYSRCNCYQSTLKSDVRAHLARTGGEN